MNKNTITIRRSERDRYGDKVSSVEHSISGWVLSPGGSSEDQNHNDQVSEQRTAYGPPDVDVEANDEVVLSDGSVWQMNGAPLPYHDPFAGQLLSSTVLHLERVSG